MDKAFEFNELSLSGAYAIRNFCHYDNRGDFIKSYDKEIYEEAGITVNINETFVSVSSKNVLRGLHFQLRNPQAKLVCVLKGKAWDVIVDLRKSSPTYKKWISVELGSEGKNAVYIPRGFAHGFVSMADETTMMYQCDGPYDKETDTGILYNDPVIGINWPVDITSCIFSERDLNLMSFEEFERKALEYGTYR